MADTTTTTYGLVKPEPNASQDTWGTKLNANLDSIDDLLDGTTAIKPNLSEGLWKVGGVAVTATAAEINSVTTKAPIASPTFTGAVDAGDSVTLGSFTIYDSGTDLIVKYGANTVFKITSTGAVVAEGDVTAFGTV